MMMVFELKFADVGEGVHEGEVLEIYVNVGDSIKVEQDIIEVHTEKVTTAITSPVGGKIASINCDVGDTIKVGQVIVTIDTAGDANSATSKTTSVETEEEKDDSLFKPSKPFVSKAREKKKKSQTIAVLKQKTGETTTKVNERVLAAPAVRRRAREQGIDLHYVQGSGPAGRIKQEDLENYHKTGQIQSQGAQYEIVPGSESRVPLKGTRKTIARAMRHSKDTAAHYSYFEEVDMTALDDLRQQLKPMMEEKGIKVTYVALVMKCLVPALRKFPILNSELDEENNEIIIRDYFNIGISVDTDDGLVVPVVKNVEQKSLWQIAEEIIDLATRAREGRLRLDDISGGTFTVTSIGNIGGMMATPIIKSPESAILGLMKAKLRPVVIEKYGKPEIAIRNIMYLSLSLDHRIVDGAVGARFINELIRYMENPALVWIDH